MPGSKPTLIRWQSAKPNRGKSVPAYAQIAEGMQALLKSGALPAGSPLPAERVLCEEFGVSRMTLRQAFGILERDGLLESHRGRGTFVALNRFRKQQQELRSFTEEILARGGVPESKLLSFKTIPPDAAAAKFFDLSEHDAVFEIRRLRMSDKAPIAVETVRMPQRLCPGLEKFDIAKHSLYAVLEQNYGIIPEACTEEISAELPSAADRKLLGLARSAAVLVVNRRTHTDSGQALEMTRAIYRGDLYSAIVHSVRRKRSPET